MEGSGTGHMPAFPHSCNHVGSVLTLPWRGERQRHSILHAESCLARLAGGSPGASCTAAHNIKPDSCPTD
eukprot:2484385-Amphidinium_carterae.1